MKPDTVNITVNGVEIQAPEGAKLLDVLRQHGFEIPTLCHDDRLLPYGGCRLCLVERKDRGGGLVPACATPVYRGMEIESNTPAVEDARRRNLQLLVLNHRMECPVCERNGDCRLQDLLYVYGVEEELLPFELVRRPRDESSPVIVRDPEKCVLCGRCVRLCDEVQGVAELGLVNRGLEAYVSTFFDRPLDCEFCGQCVNACPVGALIARPYASDVPVWLRQRRTTSCSFCSCGCQLEFELFQGRVVRVTSTPGSAPNDGNLCAKGWLGWDVVVHPERLVRPLVRRNGRLAEASWDEALEAVVEGAMRARKRGQKLAAVATPRLLTEDALLLSRLLREGLGGAMVSLGPEAGVRALLEGVRPVLGAPVSTGSFADLRSADLVLVLRADPGRTHPLVKTELVRRHRQDNREFVLAAPVGWGLERHARPFLHVRPGTELALVGAVSRELLRSGRLSATPPGFQEWTRSLEPYTVERAAELTGLDPAEIRSLAARIAAARTVLLVVATGRGIPGDEAEVTRAAASLAAALGDGARLLVLGEKGNVHGCVRAGLAQDPPERIVEEALEGRLGWLYLLGADPAGVWPGEYPGRELLERAELVVVQDAFLNDTARCANVVLPAAVLVEREGTGFGPDLSVREYRRVLAPPGEALPDGEVLRRILHRLGVDAPSPEALRADAVALGEVGPGEVRLHPLPEPVPPAPTRGVFLDLGPDLFHSGSTTRHSGALVELSPPVAVRISPGDARELGVGDGDAVRLVADGTEVLLRALVDRRVPPGVVRAPWGSGNDGASRLVRHDGEVVTVDLWRS